MGYLLNYKNKKFDKPTKILYNIIMKTITQIEAIEVLKKIDKTQPICISALTEVKLNKKDSDKNPNPFEKVFKLNKICGFVGQYSSIVENHLKKDAADKGQDPSQISFQAQERTWGNSLSLALLENKGKFYVAIHVNWTGEPIYFTDKEGMLLQIHKKDIEAFFPPKKENNPQELTNPVIYRNYSLSGVKYLAIAGEKYRIQGEVKLTEEAEIEHEILYKDL